ncbi:heat shock 70 kDa protein 12B-like isoform X2 [Ruditapes philippinarum]|uniref:heat shock 70 kDa protein 12B-like isoform X2 n=1 Tax=Ruditapes philippinarum TaxID=129788 RepID=UPI00295BB9FA|nr:heat shock 70 kDa protein 12B-like isoform X2 [Ruditapes philippinarum]
MEVSIIQKPDLVVAIDFGSTYSGYAWQWRTDFLRNKGNIEFNTNWGSGALQLHKTTTCLLLKANGDDESEYEIDSFGYKAERIYINMSKEHEKEKKKNLDRGDEDNSLENFYLFKRFKHLLYTKEIDDKMKVEDQLDRHFPLFHVLSKFLKALKDHFINNLKEKGQRVNLDKTLWVVTVPAIWSEKAKAFMRKAMEKALMEETEGIEKSLTKKKRKNLLLALEPEAAAIYCIHLPCEQRANMNDFGAPGQVFLTADLGGLTADLSAVKVLDEGLLEEVCLSTGQLTGGQNVNDAFFQACHNNFDGDSWNKTFGKSTPTECLEMEDDFEQKKVTIGKEDQRLEKIVLKVPYTIMKEIDKNNITLKETNDFYLEENEMKFTSELVRNKLFKETCAKMYDVMKEDLESKKLKDCRTVVLVGGFAESPIVVQHIREAIKKNFPNMKVVVPTSPFQAVLKGAVLYGHDPMIFRSRIARYTYGVGINHVFDEKRHDKEKKWLNTEDNKYYCKDVLAVHVAKGQSVILKEQLEEHRYRPTYKNQKSVNISIYASDRAPMNSTVDGEPKDVIYITDEGCEKIGEIDVEIPDTLLGTERNLLVRMVYGGTELSVIVIDETSGKDFPLSIKLI